MQFLNQLEFGSPLYPLQEGIVQEPKQELLTSEDRRKLAKAGSNIGKRSSTLKRRSGCHGSNETFQRPAISNTAEAKLLNSMSGRKTPESPAPKSK